MPSAQEKIDRMICSRSFHAFAFGIEGESGEVRRFLRTKDEHDPETPIKPFPDQMYLRVMADLLCVGGGFMTPAEARYAKAWGVPVRHLEHLHESRKMAVEKSRQVKITWVVLAYLLWRAKYVDHQLIMVQSKRAQDANALVCERKDDNSARLCVMEQNLPEFLQTVDFGKGGSALKGEVGFPNGSKVLAIPEGGSKIRSRTPSVLFSDEAAFQPQFGEAYKAALPAVNGGGQAIFVSSAEIGEFQSVVGADAEETNPDRVDYEDMITHPDRYELIEGGMRDGLRTRINADSNLFVCRLYHTADNEKNPATPEGRVWMFKEEQGYPGGLNGPGWQKEMAIKYTAGGGEKAFPNIGVWRQHSSIFIPRLETASHLHDAQVWASYDHGLVNPCCYLVHLVFPRDQEVWYQTVWELYAPGLQVYEIAKIIKGEQVTTADGRVFTGNPFAGKELIKICDPEIDRRTQQTRGPSKRVIELFREEGVHFTKGESGDDLTVADYIKGTLWRDPYRPHYQISEACEHLIWELSKLQHKKRKGIIAKNEDEGLVDVDNHAWDALKYFLKRFPMGSRQQAPAQKENTWAWWMDLNRDPLHERVKSRYRRVG